MKKFILSILLVASYPVFASCPVQQDLDIKTKIIPNAVQAGGNHGYFDQVKISVPATVQGLPLINIELTYGEVAEYWIPLATQVESGRIVASIVGYADSIKPFEFWVNYSDGTCNLYQAGSIGSAYNKPL